MPFMVLLPSYSILTPLQAIGILIWYIVREIIENEEEKWYKYSRASLIMVLTQVANGIHCHIELVQIYIYYYYIDQECVQD